MGRHSAVFAKTTMVILLALLAASCGDDSSTSSATPDTPDPGVEVDEVDEVGCEVIESPAPVLLEVGVVFEHPDNGNGHEACSSGFDLSPPTSGDHFDAWQNCGFYTARVRDYAAVHALEHGAVWIAYQPDLPAAEIAAIEAAFAGETHLLAAPYPGLQNPIVLSAWTRQLAVDSWADPSVDEFLDNFLGRLSTTAPEAGVRCSEGFGVAPDQPDSNYAAVVEAVR
jgi:hypothetical protein